jgi:uncharacterized membrane protein/protein-disulfide isomerase
MTAVLRRFLWMIMPLLLSAAGLAVAIVLLREHLTVNEGGVAGGLFCGGGGRFDCSAVAAHESSWLFGRPLAMWGVLYFILLTALALAALMTSRADRALARRVALVLTIASFAFDLWLSWVMVARIGAICLNCVATYVLNFLLLLVLWRQVRKPPEAPAAVDSSAPRGTLWIKAGIFGAALAGGVFTFAYTHDEVTLVRELAVQETDEFLAQLSQPPPFDMARLAGHPSRGAAEADLQIAVASDFQCAYCRSLAAHLERLMAENPGRIRVIYLNAPVSRMCNPLIKTNRHKYACWLARTANCAAAQGKFWEYHDLVYSTLPQILVDSAHVASRLESIGLDVGRVNSCLDSGEAQTMLERELAFLTELDLKSIPSLVINGYPERAGIYPSALRAIVHTMLERGAAGRNGGIPAPDSLGTKAR